MVIMLKTTILSQGSRIKNLFGRWEFCPSGALYGCMEEDLQTRGQKPEHAAAFALMQTCPEI